MEKFITEHKFQKNLLRVGGKSELEQAGLIEMKTWEEKKGGEK